MSESTVVQVAGHAIELELEDGDVVTEVVVLARVQRMDGEGSALVFGASTPDYMTQLGMMHYGMDLMTSADED